MLDTEIRDGHAWISTSKVTLLSLNNSTFSELLWKEKYRNVQQQTSKTSLLKNKCISKIFALGHVLCLFLGRYFIKSRKN